MPPLNVMSEEQVTCVADVHVLFPCNGLTKLPEMPFVFPFNLTSIFSRPIMVRIPILVHSWKTRTRISTLFCRTGLTRSLALSVALAREQDSSRNSVLMVSLTNLGSASDWLKICLWNFCSQSPQMSFCRGTPGG